MARSICPCSSQKAEAEAVTVESEADRVRRCMVPTAAPFLLSSNNTFTHLLLLCMVAGTLLQAKVRGAAFRLSWPQR